MTTGINRKGASLCFLHLCGEKVNLIPNEKSAIVHLLEIDKDQQNDLAEIIEEDEVDEEELGPESYILCRQCHQVISSKDDRIFRDGAHQHTFANPNGLVFNIGCFHTVTGCAYAGPLSNEFTWFKGYSWRAVMCRMCLAHLGWLFVSSSGDSFHGLILDRLLE